MPLCVCVCQRREKKRGSQTLKFARVKKKIKILIFFKKIKIMLLSKIECV